MANSAAPDPRDFESWEDAFQHPIPAVRGMEKKLRNGALENQEKLRTLVGGSYRDLLGTARTIIEADKQMQEVEKLLVNVGRRCDSRIVDKIAANHARLEAHNASRHNAQYALASQLFVLKKCLAVISRLLRTRGSTLLTAKLLVVSRLLHKTLSSLSDAPVASGVLGSRLVSLRQRLLRHIDRRFERSYVEVAALVEDMTAFSLATSSSPPDVLRHFQHLRLDAIKRPLQGEQANVKASITRRLQTYIDTQRETKAIYPDLLQASLKTLSARALLDDPSVLAMDELGLDNHLQWIPSEVKYFTPWTRHDELPKSRASQSFSVWAEDGLKALMHRLSDDLAHEADLELLAGMRVELLQMWLSNRHHVSGISPREVLREMRLQFLARVKDLVQASFRGLHDDVTQAALGILRNWDQASISPGNFFDPTSISMDIGNGASSFRNTVINLRLGRSTSINEVLGAYEARIRSVETIETVIRQMREVRWDDDQGLSDSEDDDAEPSSSTQHVLCRDDPSELQQVLRVNAVDFARNLDAFFNTEISASDTDCSSPTAPGLFTLRLVREMRRRVPLLLQNIDHEAATQPLCSDLVTKLHASLAQTIQRQASSAYEAALTKFVHSKRNPGTLWEGTWPPLPIQITPSTFKALRATVKEMETMGPDVWTPGAVVALRSALDDAFGTALNSAVEELESLASTSAGQHASDTPNVNGVIAAPGSPEEHQYQHAAQVQDPGDPDQPQPPDSPKQPSKTDASPASPTSQPVPAANGTSSTDHNANSEEAQIQTQLTPTLVKAKATQLLFDALYLSHALALPQTTTSTSTTTSALAQDGNGVPSHTSAKLTDAVAALARQAGLQSDGHGDAGTTQAQAMARLSKGAGEYWRRTYLLFGLLSCPL